MDAIVQAAGTALVQAIATDSWRQVKEAISALWHRVHAEQADQLGRDLDELRAQVLQAHADGDAQTCRALEGTWQVRLQGFLRADPAVAAELRQILDRVLIPAAAQAGTVVMRGTSRDFSAFTQIGSQINYGRS
jgi:hypothetical protein